jgi:hypothetical protein
MHVHVVSAGGEVKYRLEPELELARNYRFDQQQIRQIQSILERHRDEVIGAWREHFGS